jgi:hypothetical protein
MRTTSEVDLERLRLMLALTSASAPAGTSRACELTNAGGGVADLGEERKRLGPGTRDAFGEAIGALEEVDSLI